MTYLRYYTGTHLEKMSKTMKMSVRAVESRPISKTDASPVQVLEGISKSFRTESITK